MKKHVRRQMVPIGKSVGAKPAQRLGKAKAKKGARTNAEEALSCAQVDQRQRVDSRIDLSDIIDFIRKSNPRMAQVLVKKLWGYPNSVIALTEHLNVRTVERLFEAARDIIRGAFQGMLPG